MRKNYLLIAGFIFVLISIPIAVFLVKQNQDLREHASGPSPTITPTTTPEEITLNSNEWDFLQIINSYRTNLGLNPLKISVKLEQAAKWEANDLAVAGVLSHTDSLGRDPNTRIQSFGYSASATAENVAASSEDAQTAFNQFISACDPDSSDTCQYTHKVNIERPEMNAIGIAAQTYTTGQYQGDYAWVTDFGSLVEAEITPPTTTPTITESQPSPTDVIVTQEISPTVPPASSETPTLTPTSSPNTPTLTPILPTATPTVAILTPTFTPTPTSSVSATPIIETPTVTSAPTTTIANPGGMTQTTGIIAGAIIIILGGLFLLAL